MATAERARRSGTAASFLTADMMLADGSLAAAQRIVDGGAQAVLTSALEVEHGSLRRRRGRSGTPLSLSMRPRWCSTRSPNFARELRSDDRGRPLLISSLASFAVEGGLAFRGFHFLPLMVAPTLLAATSPSTT